MCPHTPEHCGHWRKLIIGVRGEQGVRRKLHSQNFTWSAFTGNDHRVVILSVKWGGNYQGFLKIPTIPYGTVGILSITLGFSARCELVKSLYERIF